VEVHWPGMDVLMFGEANNVVRYTAKQNKAKQKIDKGRSLYAHRI